jgi:hypothetical protein
MKRVHEKRNGVFCPAFCPAGIVWKNGKSAMFGDLAPREKPAAAKCLFSENAAGPSGTARPPDSPFFQITRRYLLADIQAVGVRKKGRGSLPESQPRRRMVSNGSNED